MFPNTCNNCNSDNISGPHKVSSIIGQPVILIDSKKLIGKNKTIKMESYVCMNCREVKLFAVKKDLAIHEESLNKPIHK